eukprot:6976612-Prymnesium_polylepis.1
MEHLATDPEAVNRREWRDALVMSIALLALEEYNITRYNITRMKRPFVSQNRHGCVSQQQQ